MMAFMDKLYIVSLISGLALVFMMTLSGKTFHLGVARKMRSVTRVVRIVRRPFKFAKTKGKSNSHVPFEVSAIMVGLAIAIFGASGLLCRVGLNLGGAASFGFGVVTAPSVTMTIAAGLWKYLLIGSEDGEIKGVPMEGTIGHLSIPIPEGGVGAIAYISNGKRVTLPARSWNGGALPKSARVMVREMSGRTAIVEAF